MTKALLILGLAVLSLSIYAVEVPQTCELGSHGPKIAEKMLISGCE